MRIGKINAFHLSDLDTMEFNWSISNETRDRVLSVDLIYGVLAS